MTLITPVRPHESVQTVGRTIAAVTLCVLTVLLVVCPQTTAAVRVAHIFGDDMVIQRDKPVSVWGWADKGEKVTVSFAGRTATTKAQAGGKWKLKLDAVQADGKSHAFTVKGPSNTVTFKNVVIGEVWVCGGQSNMEASLANIRGSGLELAAARPPDIRVMTIPLAAGPEPLADFQRIDEYNSWTRQTERKGYWLHATPDRARLFPAVGYFFAKHVQHALGVPIGLIDTSWGGTTVEAWISRPTLKTIPQAKGLLDLWDRKVAAYDPAKSLEDQIKRWKARAARFKAAGRPVGEKPTKPRPSPAVNRNNPGASYNKIIAPIRGLTVRGVLFYQGINNCVGDAARPDLYATLFAELIPEWRRVFDDEDLPFGICQTISWGFPSDGSGIELDALSAAPYIREAQLKAHLALPNTGLIPVFDLGHIQMHSPYKKPIAERAAKWALSQVYQKKIPYSSAVCTAARSEGETMVLTFSDHISSRFGGRHHPGGFIIAGADKRFYHADAAVSGKQVTVSSPFVKAPKAVRYAWATFPQGDVTGNGDIPISPFRTDTWPGREDSPLAERNSEAYRDYSRRRKARTDAARQQGIERRLKEARGLLEQAQQAAASAAAKTK